jgi:hypothetical protein
MVRFGDGYDYERGEQLGYPQEWLDAIGLPGNRNPNGEGTNWTIGTDIHIHGLASAENSAENPPGPPCLAHTGYSVSLHIGSCAELLQLTCSLPLFFPCSSLRGRVCCLRVCSTAMKQEAFRASQQQEQEQQLPPPPSDKARL